MKKLIFLFLAILFFSSTMASCTKVQAADKPAVAANWSQPSQQAEVKNTLAKQVGNRAVFMYDLISNEVGAEVEVEVSLTVQGKFLKTSDLNLEGDFGKVRTGMGKTIYWNALQDFPRGFSDEITWELAVKSNKTYQENTPAGVKKEKKAAKKVKKVKKDAAKVEEAK